MPGETEETRKRFSKKSYKPTVDKGSTGRSAAIQKGIAENWQRGQDKKTAADDARADIIKRSQTGNVDREDYRGGRHKYGMGVDDYHNMMGTVPQKKYGEMFPYSAGIPQLLSKVFSKFPGINMAGDIMRSIQGSDAGTMTKDLITNPLKNLYQNITGNKATNPDAVSIVDNDWEKVSGNALDDLFNKDKLSMWPDLTATTTEDELGPLVSSVTGGRGDLSPGFDYETDRHNREQSAKKAFLKQFNPDIDFDNVNVAPHIDALYQRELEKQQADEVWDEGIGSLTEPTPYPETDENVHRNYWSEGYTLPLQQDPGFDEEYEEIRDTLPEEQITDTVVEDQIPSASAVDPDLQRKQDMWNYGLGQMLSRQYPYVGGDPWSDEAPYDKRHPNTLREMLDSMSETERDYVQHGGIGSDAVNSLIENLGGFNLQATDWMNEGGGSYAKYLENMKERFGPHTRVRKDEMLRQMLPKYPRKEGFFEKLPFHSGPFDFNFQSEKQLPWKYGDLFNLFTPDYNKGGIASLQSGGQPGPFSDSTTVTDEEIIDIQPLQMDPGIMGIGDLEDLFEEAKVKESIYDKLKYVNNTMHG
jgi:hypothetical protein